MLLLELTTMQSWMEMRLGILNFSNLSLKTASNLCPVAETDPWTPRENCFPWIRRVRKKKKAAVEILNRHQKGENCIKPLSCSWNLIITNSHQSTEWSKCRPIVAPSRCGNPINQSQRNLSQSDMLLQVFLIFILTFSIFLILILVVEDTSLFDFGWLFWKLPNRGGRSFPIQKMS